MVQKDIHGTLERCCNITWSGRYGEDSQHKQVAPQDIERVTLVIRVFCREDNTNNFGRKQCLWGLLGLLGLMAVRQ